MMSAGSLSFQVPFRSLVVKLAAVNDGSYLVTYRKFNPKTKHPNCYFDTKSIHQYCQKQPLTRQYSFPGTIIDFVLADNRKVVVLLTGGKMLWVIDLERQTKTIASFGIKCQEMQLLRFSSRIVHFRQTNLVGLVVNDKGNGRVSAFQLKGRNNEGIQMVKNIKGVSNKEEGGLVASYFSFVKAELRINMMQNLSSKGLKIVGKGNNHPMVAFYREKELELILVEVVKLEGGKASPRVRKINFNYELILIEVVKLEGGQASPRVRKINLNSECSFFLCWQIATDQVAIFPRLKDILKRIQVLDLSDGQQRQIEPNFTSPEVLDFDFDGNFCRAIIMRTVSVCLGLNLTRIYTLSPFSIIVSIQVIQRIVPSIKQLFQQSGYLAWRFQGRM